jgi:hypothetical protein
LFACKYIYSTARQIPPCKTPRLTNMSKNWSKCTKCTNFPAAGGERETVEENDEKERGRENE